jgi:Ni,Fe-hydrogenase I large subunit
MSAIFGGKMPHVTAMVPTGTTSNPAIQRILRYKTRLEECHEFINSIYLPDVVAVAKAFPQYFKIGKGPDSFLCAGGFRESSSGDCYLKSGAAIGGNLEDFSPDLITEDVKYSYYSSRSQVHPFEGETKPDPEKPGAYSWLKAPRYRRKVVQVGPLARMIVQYMRKSYPDLNQMVDKTMEELGIKLTDLNSVMGRHFTRAIEAKMIAERAMKWLDQLRPSEPTSKDFDIPEESRGFGCTEAPRGTLGHWLKIKNYVIEKYQCVVPTTWNCSPRDDDGQPGAVEQALEGCPVADQANPIELGRIVRSFDPCLACSIH